MGNSQNNSNKKGEIKAKKVKVASCNFCVNGVSKLVGEVISADELKKMVGSEGTQKDIADFFRIELREA